MTPTDPAAQLAHTPGPWYFVDSHDQPLIRRGNHPYERVLYLGDETEPLDAQDRADAWLIAAAPDLLATLGRVVSRCPLCSNDDSFVAGVTAEGLLCGFCLDARRAIAAATGGVT